MDSGLYRNLALPRRGGQGSSACEEVGDLLARCYPDRRISQVPAHNDLMTNTRYQACLMGVTPLMMVVLNPLVSAFTLLQAKLHGLMARASPLLVGDSP